MKLAFCLILLCFSLQYVSAQNLDIPDAKFKNVLVNVNCVDFDLDGVSDSPVDTDNDGEISLAEALEVKNLDLRLQGIINLDGLESFANLDSLVFSQNYIVPSVDVTNMPKLKTLVFNSCKISEIDLSQNPLLENFECAGNPLKEIDFSNNLKLKNVTSLSCQLESIDFTGLNELEKVLLSFNNLVSLKIEDKPNLKELYCSDGMLEELTLSNLPNLEILYCFKNNLSQLNVEGMAALKKLYCHDNQLTSLNINGTVGLEGLLCNDNELTQLELGSHPNLKQLWCFYNQITSLNFNNTKNIIGLFCNNNQITELEVVDMPKLSSFSCNNNLLNSLKLSNLDSLDQLKCYSNELTILNLDDLPVLRSVNATGNRLEQITFDNSNAIEYLRINNNQLTHLDISNIKLLKYGTCRNNDLKTLIIKNGVIDENLDFRSNPNLEYICIDDEEEDYITNYLLANSHDMVELNSYCSFQPGVDFGTVKGNFYSAESIADCNSTVAFDEYVRINIESKLDTSFVIHSAVQEYQIPLIEDTFLLTPVVGQLGYYGVEPEKIEVAFPEDPNPFVQDFCVYKLGSFNDLDIVIIPLGTPVPGFESDYKIIYSNKGTTTQSGKILLSFMDNLVEYNSSNPTASIQNMNQLTWSFLDLEPFEKRTIELRFTLNTPTDDPPLNSGDVISMNANISSDMEDETPDDNLFVLEEVVINSFDPNDKTCLQGSTIPESKIDDDVFYKIRFENTGTAPARNVVVKDEIDLNVFDISSVQLVDASHSVQMRQVNPNIIEFIFEQIYLPFEEDENQGYVVFKIKIGKNLAPGDVGKNSAQIYFDFNHPIITDTSEFVIVKDADEDSDLDGYSQLDDCNDNDYSINPGVDEIPYNGIDDDCNALTLDDDLDQDGFMLADDCDDNNANVNPNQIEKPYNGLDDDCNALTLDDDFDQDGFMLADDCDDNNANINPGQIEDPYNGIDDDCNALTFDDDVDQDGFILIEDCDDNNSNVNPNQTEEPYNGLDDDCNALTLDDDLDQDGFMLAEDCDDNNSNVNPNQIEEPYNGIDDDCNASTLDDDLDQDGFILADDCDDNNSEINPNAEEIPNNGIDEDCDGLDLVTSIHELSETTINIFPNPAIDIINIEVKGQLDFQANLYTPEGQLVQSNRNTNMLSVESFANGVYLLEIKDLNSNKSVIQKIIIRK